MYLPENLLILSRKTQRDPEKNVERSILQKQSWEKIKMINEFNNFQKNKKEYRKIISIINFVDAMNLHRKYVNNSQKT